MALPKKPTTGRTPVAPTRRGAPATGRMPGKPPPPRKNNMPLIAGGAAGGALLLIIIIAMVAGGPSRPKRGVAEPEAPVRVEPPKKFVPDVSALEAEGKTKCNDGLKLLQPRLNPDPTAPKDRVWADLENGLKLIKAGLAAYKTAAEKAGKTYPLDEFKKAQSRGIKLLCADLEKQAYAACDEGLKIIQSTEGMMTGKTLPEDDRKKLKTDLEKGKKLIEEGMNLFDRSYQVSEHTFDTNKYGQALKMTRAKLLELK